MAPLIGPTATIEVSLVKRLPQNTGGNTAIFETGASTTSAAASATSTGQQQQGWGWGGTQGQLLNWAAIAVVVGLMCAVGGWRLATMRHRSWKGFFLPKGLRIKWLGIDIAPPPPPPRAPTLQEIEMQRRAQRAEERFQRRRTRGDNIGDGGQRRDGRTEDESDDEADRDTLPGYKADVTAPVYLEEWREEAVERGDVPEIDPETADAIRAAGDVVRPGAEGAGTGDAGDERIMSVAEYEARQRAGPADDDEHARNSTGILATTPSAPAATTSAAPPAIQTPAEQSDTPPRSPLRPAVQRLPSGQPPMYEVNLREDGERA